MDRRTIEAVKGIYSKRSELIIFGLTGRTGSGCTQVSKILGRKEFNELDLREPKTREYKDADERKYEIVHNFMKHDQSRWVPFETIEVSSVIFSFVLEHGYKELANYLSFISTSDSEDGLIFDNNEVLKRLQEHSDLFAGMDKYKLPDSSENPTADRIKELTAFYYNDLKKRKEEFKNMLNGLDCSELANGRGANNRRKCDLYSRLMQKIGNNLRSSSNPFLPEFKGELPSILISRIEALISLLFNSNGKKNTRICIDAIRNPYEAFYLRDRYRSFYLLSINTDDYTRRKRLEHLKKDELDNLDAIEYPKEFISPYDIFLHQNIQGCLEASDIHIYNPDALGGKFYLLTEQIVKYLSLVLHPGLITPTAYERCMQIAYNAKLNSGCISRQVGAIVTDKYFSVKAVGWNDVPKGQIACNLRDMKNYLVNRDEETYSTYEICNQEFCDVANGVVSAVKENNDVDRLPFCFKDIYNAIKNEKNQVYTRSLHAEENAFLQIAKYGGQGLQGGYLFTTASPCELCAKKAYQLEISKIFYIDPYPGISQDHILSFGKNSHPETHLFYGAIGNAYISLYTPRIAYKDELALVAGVNFKSVVTKLVNKESEDLPIQQQDN